MYEVNRTQVTDEPVEFEKISQHVGLGNTRNWIDCAQNSPRSWVPKQTPKQLEVGTRCDCARTETHTSYTIWKSSESLALRIVFIVALLGQ